MPDPGVVTEGLIDDIESADGRRGYYRITAAGRKAMKSDAARLPNVVKLCARVLIDLAHSAWLEHATLQKEIAP